LDAQLPVLACARGCDDKVWKAFLFNFVTTRGCVPCFQARSPSYDTLEVRPGCLVGKVALHLSKMLSLLYSEPRGRRHATQRVARPYALHAMDLASSCGDEALLPLISLTGTQVTYLVDQLLYNFTRRYSVEAAREDTDQDLVIDVGLELGNDAKYYIQQGYRVVAVDADAAKVRHVAAGFPHAGLTALQAKIGWPMVGGVADESVTTCDDLIRRFGVPHYLKVDTDGMELACLATLDRKRLPRYVSVEILDSSHLENCCEQEVMILKRLNSLGYTHFKLVRQRSYNVILDTSELGPHATIWSGSGPFGEDAVDFQHGKSWRDVLSVLELLEGMKKTNLLEVELLLHMDWYDLHAKRL